MRALTPLALTLCLPNHTTEDTDAILYNALSLAVPTVRNHVADLFYAVPGLADAYLEATLYAVSRLERLACSFALVEFAGHGAADPNATAKKAKNHKQQLEMPRQQKELHGRLRKAKHLVACMARPPRRSNWPCRTWWCHFWRCWQMFADFAFRCLTPSASVSYP
ncbi:hypothetical protein SPRG_15391 [Saprolegnia parasitica CBS 223.65]|uniref:Uncharacterized protein n=1 Tax=Saprolegnia parasitica (strain CBS 223.65) TaxID=695850 RepID=A0A067BYE0_SAPPC|nr:hypothetical protein SPRG_15391 [Saprolegnia parasitica CBS 223.65]KDO19331.1 hypothetical protein SPRG_15391 [Saprolegnia parasitica CBS 223.65]|eukprot:XP_012209951.1 hypothetical protein SPRG_15391 [Saprolegnia parasitica CBS 223.65]